MKLAVAPLSIRARHLRPATIVSRMTRCVSAIEASVRCARLTCCPTGASEELGKLAEGGRCRGAERRRLVDGWHGLALAVRASEGRPSCVAANSGVGGEGSWGGPSCVAAISGVGGEGSWGGPSCFAAILGVGVKAQGEAQAVL